MRSGYVSLRTDQCFTFKGPECGACGGLCPEEIKATNFRLSRPQVDGEACIGCGERIEACPTIPKSLQFHERTWADKLTDDKPATLASP